MKVSIANEFVISFGFLFVGVVTGIILIPVHELLHAIAFPKDAVVYIGVMPKSFAALALSSSPVKRNRFIFISILPIILGVVPLVIFCFSSNNLKALNSVLWGIAVMGMTSVYPDFYNVYYVLKMVPGSATLQNNGNETYYFG